MYQKIVDLLQLHGYKKRNTKVGPCYVKDTEDETKGVYIVYDQNPDGSKVSEEEHWKMIQEAKGEFSGDVAIMLLVLSETGQAMFFDPEKRFEELFPPVNMILSGNREEKESSERIKSIAGNIWLLKGTLLIIFANVLVFWITQESGNQIYNAGASNYHLVLDYHQYYRLFTSNYIHFGWNHLFNNMLVLLFMGSQLEQMIGTIRYVILYTGAGFVGSIVSVYYYASIGESVFSAGASGAIFGISGALAALFLFARKKLGPMNGTGILIMLAGTLYHGFQSGTVDNAAHIGGCIGGFVIMAVLLAVWRGKSK